MVFAFYFAFSFQKSFVGCFYFCFYLPEIFPLSLYGLWVFFVCVFFICCYFFPLTGSPKYFTFFHSRFCWRQGKNSDFFHCAIVHPNHDLNFFELLSFTWYVAGCSHVLKVLCIHVVEFFYALLHVWVVSILGEFVEFIFYRIFCGVHFTKC